MSIEQKDHILDFLEKGIRFDGRKLDEYRPIKIERGFSENAEGSARVTIGDTEVLAGVKMSIMEPYPDTPDEGTMMINVELLPLSNPDFEPGPPGIQAIEIARVVDRGIRESKAIDTKKLCLKKREKVWSITVDICPINDDGNLFDASALAVLAALQDAKFPSYDGTVIDYKKKTKESLPLKKLPVSCTVIKIDNYFIVDPTPEEEKKVDSRLTVEVEEDGTLCALQKGGDKPLTAEDIDKMVGIGIEKSKELKKLL
ncbi:exosome complex protein Rrp42 [Candidatus Woesearchaeota archaeon]|nr:exosome complex protein Rrp42 [Candidatus Woesearchaeota archaeon]